MYDRPRNKSEDVRMNFIHKMRYKLSAHTIQLGVWFLPDPYTKSRVNAGMTWASELMKRELAEAEEQVEFKHTPVEEVIND